MECKVVGRVAAGKNAQNLFTRILAVCRQPLSKIAVIAKAVAKFIFADAAHPRLRGDETSPLLIFQAASTPTAACLARWLLAGSAKPPGPVLFHNRICDVRPACCHEFCGEWIFPADGVAFEKYHGARLKDSEIEEQGLSLPMSRDLSRC